MILKKLIEITLLEKRTKSIFDLIWLCTSSTLQKIALEYESPF